QHPPQPPQSEDLLFLLFVQDIGHAHGAYKPPRESMSRTPLSLAGFQVILIGRFWVIAEAKLGLVDWVFRKVDAQHRAISHSRLRSRSFKFRWEHTPWWAARPTGDLCHSSKHRTPAISMTWHQARLATFR